MAGTVRLTHRRTGSVVVVPEGKAASLAILGFETAAKPSSGSTAKKAPAKKTTAKPSSKK